MLRLEPKDIWMEKSSNCSGPAVYTVSRCRRDNTLFGPVHFADDDNFTRCGKLIDKNWFVITNNFNGDATCKRCLYSLGSVSGFDVGL